MADSGALIPSTPPASAAVAQSHGPAAEPDDFSEDTSGSVGYRIGNGVRRAAQIAPYERQKGDPIYRPLRIYALDAAESRMDGGVALVNVPFEALEPGPVGSVFEVDNYDGWQDLRYRRIDLDDPRVLIRNGIEPTPSDPQFHQQMVYAVCSLTYAAFKSALGRDPAWGFEPRGGGTARLLLQPFSCEERNAFYSKEEGRLCFGYYTADPEVFGRNLPGGFVFTALSHDIIAHEVTHALLDGLRAHFILPTGPDVLAFHEAFADIVAIFQHFSYKEVVLSGIRKSRGNLDKAQLLTGLARQFGQTTSSGSDRPLRSAIEENGLNLYDSTLEPHALGSVLVSAVFDAFITVFNRRTDRYVRLATGGSGVLPEGELPADLQSVLAEEASRLAGQFLSICIRAIDYCPPVDMEFGNFLRAVITADHDLVPDDPWGYREAWIDAFARRRIYPKSVTTLSESSLRWGPPERELPKIEELDFAHLHFKGDPAHPSGLDELKRQARVLGSFVSHRDRLDLFGLTVPDETTDRPCVESIRSLRRIGPDGQVVFGLVAEVTQRRTVDSSSGLMDFYGGSTVILDPDGEIRYVVRKSIGKEERLKDQRSYLEDKGSRLWTRQEGRLKPVKALFRLLHDHGERKTG
jgi:hypothetical protein